jgi:hypothetical protein
MTDKRWKWGKNYIQLTQDPGSQTPQKAGVLNRQGWAAYYYEGNLFIKKFGFEEEAEYPDYRSNLEVYTDPDIIEIESLGPLETISPGSYAEHREKWFLSKAGIDLDFEDSIDTAVNQLIEAGII